MNPRAEAITPRTAWAARILLIDEQRVLRFVSRGLRAEGYTVDLADNGTDGLRMALTGSYDLIILDLLMQPGLDGSTVLPRIVRKLPSQQVIIVSCLTETATKVRCLEAGAADYLAKPFSLDELLARVQAHLRVLARSRTVTTLQAGRLKLDLVRREADSGSVRCRSPSASSCCCAS